MKSNLCFQSYVNYPIYYEDKFYPNGVVYYHKTAAFNPRNRHEILIEDFCDHHTLLPVASTWLNFIKIKLC